MNSRVYEFKWTTGAPRFITTGLSTTTKQLMQLKVEVIEKRKFHWDSRQDLSLKSVKEKSKIN